MHCKTSSITLRGSLLPWEKAASIIENGKLFSDSTWCRHLFLVYHQIQITIKKKTVTQKQIKVARKSKKETIGLIDIGLPQSKKNKVNSTVRPGSKVKYSEGKYSWTNYINWVTKYKVWLSMIKYVTMCLKILSDMCILEMDSRFNNRIINSLTWGVRFT